MMKETIFLGTYTRRESKGIYTIELDTATKRLTNLNTAISENGPTYLGLTSDGYLLTVSAKGGQGGLVSYKQLDNGTFSEINRITSEGASPCYVGIDNTRRLAFGANYHKGELTSYHFDTDGVLTLVDTIQHNGNGPHENQDKAHAHYSDLTPDNRLVACDLGTDGVYTYDISDEGKLTEVACYKAEPGTGPRHITFHPNKKIAYLFGELANTVTTLTYDEMTGRFDTLQTISTLPETFTEFSGGAAIRISQDGKFVYVSNRGHDSIAVFKVLDDMTLECVEIVPSEGDFPRDFTLNKSEDFLVVSHQNSDNLTLFERNKETGRLTLLQKDVYAPECVCTYITK